ncbi:MAG: tetratricopeptide repeat protein [Deltaproteobacteria bacterium]|nr:tetratricopeptide repeat protein [Deltaproteobacteria bacterium]
MGYEDWERLEEHFADLSTRSSREREKRLNEIGREDPELRSELESLLTEADAPKDLTAIVVDLAAAVVGSGESASGGRPADLVGQQIDAYRIEALLGEGGFGSVYRASQTEPVSRSVALKVVKRGFEGGAIAQRFEVERQALAEMSHPAVCQVFDAGLTEDRRPYFVMELVEGEPITEYCEHQALGLEARLGLFREVCGGVLHAHQRGILHRDLKPSNVLVGEIDGQPRVKIIDFGIAKALHGSPGSAGPLTERRQVVGTLEYMSPEQASFEEREVDVRSDVYSLGVLLYELLTGSVPFPRQQLEAVSLDEALRMVRETEPERPSTRGERISREKISRDRSKQTRGRSKESPAPKEPSPRGETGPKEGTAPSGTWFSAGSLRGDLDWIVLKTLEKDKERRYDGVGELGADIDRYLGDLPVEARPPTTAYRLKKLYRRNRAASWASLAVLLALLASLTVMALSLRRVADERDRAVRAEELATSQAKSAQRVSDFLVELFEGSDPELAEGREVPLREILDRGSRRMDELSSSEPDTATRLLTVLGRVYSSLGLYDDAAPLLEKAVGLADDTTDSMAGAGGTERDPELELARVLMHQGQLEEAETLCRGNLERARAVQGPRSAAVATALSLLGEIRYQRGDEGHKKLIEEALEIRREVLPAGDPAIGENLAALAQSAGVRNDWFTAEQLYREAAELLDAALGPWTPRTLRVRNKLVYALAHRRNSEEALPLADRSIEAAGRIYGDDHPALGDALANRGTVHYRATRDFEAALADFTTAKAVLEKTFVSSHPRVNDLRQRRGYALGSLGRHDEALAVQREVLRYKIANHGESNFLVQRQYFNVALAAQSGGHHDIAVENLMLHVALDPEIDWKNDFNFARPMHHLAISLTALGRFEEAEDLLHRARTMLTERYGAEHWTTEEQVEKLVELYERWGKSAEEARWRAELARIEEANVEHDPTTPTPRE